MNSPVEKKADNKLKNIIQHVMLIYNLLSAMLDDLFIYSIPWDSY